MTHDQVVTAWAMFAIVVLIFAFDGWRWWACGEPATISVVAREIGARWPAFHTLMAFGFGALCAHFFW